MKRSGFVMFIFWVLEDAPVFVYLWMFLDFLGTHPGQIPGQKTAAAVTHVWRHAHSNRKSRQVRDFVETLKTCAESGCKKSQFSSYNKVCIRCKLS